MLASYTSRAYETSLLSAVTLGTVSTMLLHLIFATPYTNGSMLVRKGRCGVIVTHESHYPNRHKVIKKQLSRGYVRTLLISALAEDRATEDDAARHVPWC